MRKLKTSASISVILGTFSVLGIFLNLLALTDIGHGEPNLSLEWKAVRIGFLLIALFHVSAFVTLSQIFNFLKKQDVTK